ncbi:hypothetical protein D1007_43127 [Hordeum vulgare]|nr:hypothetical protein D1007_43127 [Hordeum vulgare]
MRGSIKKKEEKMKACNELQTKKFKMKEVFKRRNPKIKEAIQIKNLEVEAINTNAKAEEVALVFMIVDLSNMSPKRSWFEKKQNEMLYQDCWAILCVSMNYKGRET